MSTEQAEGRRAARGQTGRASRSPGQLWQAPLFLLGLLAFVVAFVNNPPRQDNTNALFQAELARLRQGLEPEREKPALLIIQAEALLERIAKYPRKAGEIHFLAGSAYYRDVKQASAEASLASQKKAIHHFEEALAVGIDAGDLRPLQYRLGLLLHKQGKDEKRAIDLMAQSVDKGADRPAEGYGVLVQAYLSLPKPNLEAALAASQKQLELIDVRNMDQMAPALVTRGELLLRKDQKDQRIEALKELNRVGSGAPRDVRLKARLLQARICEEDGLWRTAIPVWTELYNETLKDPRAVPGGKARALYALGLAHFNVAEERPEQRQQAMKYWLEAFSLGGTDGDAAGIRLGELKLYDSKEGPRAALAVWAKVFESVRTANDYRIQTLELKRAREILEKACGYLLESQAFEPMQQVAELYKKIALPGLAEEHFARATEELARVAAEKTKDLDPQQAAGKMSEVRAQFDRAAVAYEEAAVDRADSEQTKMFWRSAQCYLAAKDHHRAVAVLNKLVQREKSESRLAEAYLAKAEAYVELGNKESARAAYEKCIEYPQTVFGARARYQLAVAEMVKGEAGYKEALSILEQNLNITGPGQDRAAHEKSIFKIAELHGLLNQYDKAAIYYKEATQQYPKNAGTFAARYQLAECYRQLAVQSHAKFLSGNEEQAKVIYQNDKKRWLLQGIDVCDKLSDDLDHRGRQSPLPAPEVNLLREALFSAANLTFAMNEYEEALRRYELLQDRYRKQVEGLLACRCIFNCSAVMIDTPKDRQRARAAIVESVMKATADLEKMSEDDDAFRSGKGSKKDWQGWLRWVNESLNPSATARPNGVTN